jgi:hypothetical protein
VGLYPEHVATADFNNDGHPDLVTSNGSDDTIKVRLGKGDDAAEVKIDIYRFDKNDPARAALTGFLFYYGDYARVGEVSLGGKSYKAILADSWSSGDFRGQKGKQGGLVSLLLDLNEDGKFDRRTLFYEGGTSFTGIELGHGGVWLALGLSGIRYALDQRWELAFTLISMAAVLDGLDGRSARSLRPDFGASFGGMRLSEPAVGSVMPLPSR